MKNAYRYLTSLYQKLIAFSLSNAPRGENKILAAIMLSIFLIIKKE